MTDQSEPIDVLSERPTSPYLFRGVLFALLIELAVVTVILIAVVGMCVLVGLTLPGW